MDRQARTFPAKATSGWVAIRVYPLMAAALLVSAAAVLTLYEGGEPPVVQVATVVRAETSSAVAVDERAVQSVYGWQFVYVVDGRNKVRRRPVQAVPADDGVRLVHTGLSDGDRVVISAPASLRPGMVVVPDHHGGGLSPGAREMLNALYQRASRVLL